MEQDDHHHHEYYACLPQWLESLLDEKFFVPCYIHEDARKNEKNVFCLDCCTSVCTHCCPSIHDSHRLLQVRRYIYKDVLRLDDIQKLIDCSHVQSYTSNGAKVIFINQRPQSRPFRVSGNTCSTCYRSLQERYFFCSLYCKVQHLVKLEGGVSRYLYECDFLPLSEEEGKEEDEFDYDNGMMTPDSVLESPLLSSRTHSGSSTASASGGNLGIDCRTLLSTATTDFVRKKRSSKTGNSSSNNNQYHCSSPEIAAMNRRKGIPQRSPLY
ncbi:hypothetical protein C5167_025565 [Papaver somniferum]|uniref:B box-type domain-containing protein n=1 Tax=Papaver somniferum TaxID=3469 RepID=A0A4Y7JVN0_PAPSO|nr:uncharacterized protein LOC113280570 [Papaver somniferum]RZC63818.1 hypothetical protein C5167_025565 [Papaver somniferum]